jgi:hypothetical protein
VSRQLAKEVAARKSERQVEENEEEGEIRDDMPKFLVERRAIVSQQGPLSTSWWVVELLAHQTIDYQDKEDQYFSHRELHMVELMGEMASFKALEPRTFTNRDDFPGEF